MTDIYSRLFRKSSFVILLIHQLFVAVELRTIPQKNDCSFYSANYSLTWSYDELSNDIVFKVIAKSDFDSFYTAVAFGESQPEDVISVYVRSGQIGLMDGHISDEGLIESDDKTNVQALQFDFVDGVLTAQFARPIETSDSNDVELGSCVNLFFPLETREIVPGAALELGPNLQKVRVCDLPVTCVSNVHSDLVKREEEPVCSTGPETEKNRVGWSVDGETVNFSIDQNAKKGRWYTAIGVGESMDDLNMIVAFAENGRLKKQGLYRTTGKMRPVALELDGIELKKENVVVNNGKAHFDFSIQKSFLTSRENNQGCFTLQISIINGNYQPNFNIQKHKETPSSFTVCNLDGCGSGSSAEAAVSTEDKSEPEVEENAEAEQVEAQPEAAQPEPKVEEEKEVTTTTTTKQPEVVQPIEEFQKDGKVENVEGSGNHDETVEGSGAGSVGTGIVEQKPVVEVRPDVPEEKPLTENDQEIPSLQNTLTTTPATIPVVDNQSTTKTQESINEVTAPKSIDASKGCGPDHEDLKICESYFSEYLGKVNDWSDRHNMKVTAHMWKACTLLSQVQHVTTMCCTIFRNTCATHLNI